MPAVRIGLIGAGGIAEYTARDIQSHPDARVVAIADPSLERANALAERHAGAVALSDPAQLLARDDIDAVYVAVPNRLHAGLATRALEHGKHVLLEKPFAMNLAEAEATVAAADRHGRLLMLGMNQRFDANVQRARALYADGQLGAVYHAKAFWRRRSGIPRIGSWFTSRAEAGGGALLDIGVHMLDATLFILGNFRPASVSGAAFTRFGNRGLGDGSWGRSERAFGAFDVDDFTTALIRMEDGLVIALDAAWALHQPAIDERGIDLFGDEAGLSVFNNLLHRRAADSSFVNAQGLPPGPVRLPHCNRVHHFVNVLLGREEPIVNTTQALVVQRILDAIYESARTGGEVRF
jgi:predicted dehydrogenase